MFSDYPTWWAEQMLQWLPARLTSRDREVTHALIIEPFEDDVTQGVEIVLRRQRRIRTLGRFGLDRIGLGAVQAAVPSRGRPDVIVLRLPAALLLEREVVLPLAAERDPERVLAYEMDRITPFATTEVFWTYAIERRDRVHGRLHLRLSLVPKTALEALVAALTRAGLRPTVLEVPGAEGIARRIELRRPDSRYDRFARQTLRSALSACAALAIAAVALPFVMQFVAERRVEARITSLRPFVAEAETLRHKIATNAAGGDVVQAERVRVGDVLNVLAALTELLPNDTFLTDFTMRQGKLTMSGQSGAAVRLISALSGDAVIRDPEFVAPVTRYNNRSDLFSIRAEIVR